MGILQVIGVVLMFAILIFAIAKNFKPTMVLLLLGLVAITIMNLIKGTLPGGDSTSGNFVIDLFDVIRQTFSSQLGGTALIIICAMAFVGFMDHIKASSMLCLIATKPLRHVKSPYLVVAASLIIMACINIFVPSATGRAALYLSTIFPILLASGVTPATAATTMMLGAVYASIGPSATLPTLVLGLGEPGISVPEHFLRFDLINQAILMVFLLPIFCIVQSRFDKSDKLKGLSEGEGAIKVDVIDIKTLGIPKWFAIFPTVPLILCVIFSPLVIDWIPITVPVALYIGFIFAFLCNLIFVKGDKKKLFNSGHVYFESVGEGLGTVGVMLICASIFSAGVTQIGGLDVIINSITGGTGEGVMVLVAGGAITVMYFVCIIFTGVASANAAAFATMMAGMASGSVYSKLASMLVVGGGIGVAVSPISGVTILVSGRTGLGIPRLIKRILIPGVAGMVIAIIIAAIIH